MTEEMVDVVDEDDNIIRVATRNEIIDNALLHRSALVFVVNSKNDYLIAKRSPDKRLLPGLWNLGVGETVQSGESYDSAAARGLKEEMDITVDGIGNSFLFKNKFHSDIDNVITCVFKIFYDGKIIIQKEEISEAKFASVEEIEKLGSRNLLVPRDVSAFRRYLENENNFS